MKTPVMQSEIAIKHNMEGQGILYFYATPDAASDVRQFGELEQVIHQDFYKLEVDARYNFLEVVAYIEAYGKDAQ